jgi:hypothetical protein
MCIRPKKCVMVLLGGVCGQDRVQFEKRIEKKRKQ